MILVFKEKTGYDSRLKNSIVIRVHYSSNEIYKIIYFIRNAQIYSCPPINVQN